MKKEDPMEFFKNQTEEAADYFEKWLYDGDQSPFSADGEPITKSQFCELYDLFYSREMAKNPDSKDIHHNCVGCNLEEGARNAEYFLRTNKRCGNPGYYLSMFSLLMYVMAERVAVIYQEMGEPYSASSFSWDRFPTLQLIKYWANLFKHPKAYMFLHHPTYHIETDPEAPNTMLGQRIDAEFVRTFYRAGADNVKLRRLLTDEETATVFYPDLVEFTKELCDEFSKIKQEILKDPDAQSKLDQYTRISMEADPGPSQ